MSNAARIVSKNTGALFAGSMMKMVFSFVFIIMATWKLGPQGFGEYALSVHYLELFASLIATAVGILLTREVAKNRNRINELLSSAVVLVFALGLMGCIILLLLPALIESVGNGYSTNTKTALALITLALVPAALALLAEATFVSLETAEYVTIGTVVEGITRVFLGLVLLLLGFGVISLVIVLIVSRLCLLLFYLTMLVRRVKDLHWKFRSRTFFSFVWEWRAFAAENWMSNLFNSIGVIFLSAFHGEAISGLYFAALQVMRLGTVMAASYTNAVFPYMSRLSQQSPLALQQLGNTSLRFMLAMVLPVIVTICIFSDRVVGFLFSPAFAGTADILRVSIWVLLLHFVNPFLSHILFARGEQHKSMVVAAIRLLVHVPIAYLLIPTMAGVGEAWAQLIGSIAAALVYFFFVLRPWAPASTIQMLAWTSVPAALLAGYLVYLQNAQFLFVICSGALLYICLLLILRVLSVNDLQFLQKLRSQ